MATRDKATLCLNVPIVDDMYAAGQLLRLVASSSDDSVLPSSSLMTFIGNGMSDVRAVTVHREGTYHIAVSCTVEGVVLEFYSVSGGTLDTSLQNVEFESSSQFDATVYFAAKCSVGIRVKRGFFVVNGNNHRVFLSIREL